MDVKTTLAGWNRVLAIRAVGLVGSMACFWVIAALAVVSLPAALASGSALIVVSWAVQTFFQGASLPVIMVGQDVQARRTEQVIVDTHVQVTALLTEMSEAVRDVHVLLGEMGETIRDVHSIMAAVGAAEPPTD